MLYGEDNSGAPSRRRVMIGAGAALLGATALGACSEEQALVTDVQGILAQALTNPEIADLYATAKGLAQVALAADPGLGTAINGLVQAGDALYTTVSTATGAATAQGKQLLQNAQALIQTAAPAIKVVSNGVTTLTQAAGDAALGAVSK